ncbi:EAL domain-containing protein [Nitrincola alkalilacustris]|uniref:EAL domain-containing protein n=1 Tax=Nitrincola alkalilacustris TaxID=1571224 RepID=UPI00124E9944|nr:EAL domain-containing protein [Nitrincola alkalilacustris]
MQYLAFTNNSMDISQAYHGSHAPGLVLLSVLIAILAAYTSFGYSRLMRSPGTAVNHRAWHFSGAVAMGLGVWAMHFTGMVSFSLPVEVDYQISLTLISVVPAILAAYVTLSVITRREPSFSRIALGGLLMGGGIGVMHYTGMAAMVMAAERLYQPILFALSILIAVALATLALGIYSLLGRRVQHQALLILLSSIIMGVAIASMHYVAMGATVYLPADQRFGLAGPTLGRNMLGSLAVVVSVALLLIALAAVTMRQRVQSAEQVSRRSERIARELGDRLQRIAERVPGLVYQFRLDNNGAFTFPYASEAIRDFYRISPEAARLDATPVMDMIHLDDREEVLNSIFQSATEMTPWQHEYRVRYPDGQVRWLFGNAVPEKDESGVSWSGFITDITERKATDETIERLAFHDPLTGLFNRGRIQQLLSEVCVSVDQASCMGAIFFIDLDHFKRVNDTQGHDAGDQLLKLISRRLENLAPAGSYLGRLSSDEFTLIVSHLPRDEVAAENMAEQMATNILERLQQPFSIANRSYQSSISIGACLFKDASRSSEELLKCADIAMSHAKRAGGGVYQLFDPLMNDELQERFELEQALREAIQEQQLELYYQPQVTADNQVVGAEALLRWRHPVRGMISPAIFIPLAEETGQIEQIGSWVLNQACQQLKQWQQDPVLGKLIISVNISARQFYQSNFAEQVQELLQTYQIKPAGLMLELTESLVLADLDDAVERMQVLKELGLRFSMDDFGTGYSSLSYLSRLPFDEVKIDQYFVRQCEGGARSKEWVIVEAIIGIAHTFGMLLVAEGVETEEQRKLLFDSGCTCYQGYLFARPAPVVVIEDWVRGVTAQSRN